MKGALHRRAPLVVFGAVECTAFVIWLNVGRSGWFYIDEWDFLAGRSAGDLGDVFRSHNGHWTTLPVLAFRLLFALFGLRTYVPYRVTIIVLYLVAAALLLAVTRRAGVNPWIATSACAMFALFGAGWENILLPFQMTFTGSLVFGLVYLLLADHDGPFDRRDALGLVAGLFALMCSGVGIVLVAVVGAAVLARRGRRLALLHVVPLASAYAIWLIVIGHTDNQVGHFRSLDVMRFVRTGLQSAFGAIGPVSAFGFVLVVMLVTGLALAFGGLARSQARARLAAPSALLAGSLVLLAITAVNRSAFGAGWARQSRYVSLVVAMLLPALAVAADAIATRWRWCLPLAIAVFLVGIPANLHAATRAQRILKPRDAATRATMQSLPYAGLARRVPRSLRPEPTTAGAVTIGWLLDAAAHDQLRGPGPLTPRLLASNRFRLSFARTSDPDPTVNCRTSTDFMELDLRKGEKVGVSGRAVPRPDGHESRRPEPVVRGHERVADRRDARGRQRAGHPGVARRIPHLHRPLSATDATHSAWRQSRSPG